jgi:aspartyl-tRNA(Asn)/glutamyl-tRNA(Gln) amidotransferase subunit A
MVHELLRLTLTELTSALLAKKVSPVELMEIVLDRIDETNGDLNAVVGMRARAEIMADARAAADRIARGEGRPLEGVPLGVKDLEDVAGLITSHGSLPFKDNMAAHDSVQIARLRAAGAIVVGKTNAPEFGWTAITKNLVYGVTRSPWNLEHTPGGSSGGSSAAVAGLVLPLVTASDGGGSIRLPASFTGAFGLKPSYGRIPLGPSKIWNYSDTGVQGPLTKTVEDAALFLDQAVGPSPHDPNSLPHPGYSYVERLRDPLPRGLRIAYSPDLGYAVVQSDIAAAVESGVKVLESLGNHVSEIASGPPLLGPAWSAVGNFFLAGSLHRLLPEREGEFGRAFISAVKEGWGMTPERFAEAATLRAQLNDWTTGLFEEYDLLVTPTVPFDPPPARGPFPLETEGRQQPPVGVASFTIPFNMSWHPAATVRAGISGAGFPIGMQIVGPRHRDDLVLQAALAFERQQPWHPGWPASWEPLRQ